MSERLVHRTIISVIDKMKKRINSDIKLYLVRSTSYTLLLGLAVCVIPLALAQRNTMKTKGGQARQSEQRINETGAAIPASIIEVTNTNDSGLGSLRDALAVANDGDEITFAVTGTITLTSGELLINDSIDLSGPGNENLSVNGNSKTRVFHVAPDKTVTISGLTITNGNANGQFFPDDSGGGIYNDHATTTLNNCTIVDNVASTFGGGIYNDHSTLVLNGCAVTGNFSDNAGGGLYHDGSNGSASAQVNNSTFVKNSSFGGGAIFSNGESGDAPLVVMTTVISNNSVIADGGGITNDHSQLTLDSCTVSNNSTGAAGNGGGGILNLGDNGGAATLEISNSTMSENSSQFNGGAIYSNGDFGSANVQILNSTLSGNSASNFGGAVYNRGTLGAAIVEIGTSTFSDNLAQASGDSIYNFAQMGFGGDVTASFMNAIFKTSASGQNFFNDGGTMTSLGYNVSSDDGGGFLNASGDQVNTDPLLGPLQNNGGPTLTHALLTGSPAIDTGDPSFTPPPSYDQRGPGFDRVVNGHIDIGSFEVQAGGTPTPTPTATATTTPRPTPRSSPTPRSRPTPPPRP
jgi:predicted outer membrane repeat protein